MRCNVVRTILGVFVAMLLVAACSEKPTSHPTSMTRHVLLHDGLEREYFVFLPSSYGIEKQLPVAVFLHGYGGTATGTEAESTQGLNFYAEKFGYVMVYPQGTWFMVGETSDAKSTVTSWNHISDGFDTGPDGPICTQDVVKYPCPPECGSCGQCGWTSCHDDMGFLRALVDLMPASHQVDASSVFVSGYSNGAMMANQFACEASEVLAAAALIGGRVEPGFECTPRKKLPLLQINGGNDSTVPADGSASHDGYFYASTTAITQQWLGTESCAAPQQPWMSEALSDEIVQCTVACAQTDHPAIDCIWPGSGHSWPGTPGVRGSNGYCVTELQAESMSQTTLCVAPDPKIEIWGSQLMFEFFDQHRGR